jgi:uncharacterized protein (TIGR03086 family)
MSSGAAQRPPSMTEHLDLAPAARQMAAVVAGIPDDALASPTPCPKYTVGDLLDHVAGLALAFTRAATKELGESDTPPPAEASRLAADWRTRIPADLDALAAAWRGSAAWEGMTRAGGIDMPGEVAGIVAVDELVVHGWDLARATGQDFDADAAALTAALAFYSMFDDASRGDAFGPAVAVPATAPALARVVAASGRDPEWTPG